MELFISSDNKDSKLSLAVDIFTNYVRAAQRKVVNVVPIAKSTQASLKLHDVREKTHTKYFDQLPILIKPVSGGNGDTVDEVVSTINPFGIMQEIAKGVYLEEVLFGKFDSTHRTEVKC